MTRPQVAAGGLGDGSINVQDIPRSRAANPSIWPSWPAPIMPIRMLFSLWDRCLPERLQSGPGETFPTLRQ